MVTPGSTAPEVSLTTPWIDPVCSCADATGASSRTSASMPKNRACRFILPLLFLTKTHNPQWMGGIVCTGVGVSKWFFWGPNRRIQGTKKIGESGGIGESSNRGIWNRLPDSQIPRFPDLLASRDLIPERRAAAADEGANARALLAADRRADAGADARGRSDDHRALLHRALRLDDAFGGALIADPLRCGLRDDLARIRGAHDLRVVICTRRLHVAAVVGNGLESGLVGHRRHAVTDGADRPRQHGLALHLRLQCAVHRDLPHDGALVRLAADRNRCTRGVGCERRPGHLARAPREQCAYA